jgi:hypothetical protein
MVRALGLVLAFLTLLVAFGDAGAGTGEPKRWKRKVPKNSDVIYKIKYFANQDAEFAVIGEGNTDVDIHVLDEGGREVAKDIALTDLALVRWQPAKTQVFTIIVRNLHNEDNECTMGHN